MFFSNPLSLDFSYAEKITVLDQTPFNGVSPGRNLDFVSPAHFSQVPISFLFFDNHYYF